MANKIIQCPKCGKSLEVESYDEKLFCKYCGEYVDASAVAKKSIVCAECGKKMEVEGEDKVLFCKYCGHKMGEPATEKKKDNTGAADKPEAPIAPQKDDEYPFGEGFRMAQESLAAIRKEQMIARNNNGGTKGILYSEATEEEKKNPRKLDFKTFVKEEIAPNKKQMILLLVALSVLLVGLILLSVAFPIAVIGIILVVGFVGIVVGVFMSEYNKVACKNCKTDLSGVDLKYEMVEEGTSAQGITHRKYLFSGSCPKCGTVKEFHGNSVCKGGSYDIRGAAGRMEKKLKLGERREAFWTCLAMIGIGLLCFAIGIWGLASAAKTGDPKDYYGTYYVVEIDEDYVQEYAPYMEEGAFYINIGSDKVTVLGTLAEGYGYAGKYPYEYVRTEDPEEDLDKIVVNMSGGEGLILWVLENDPYLFEIEGAIVLKAEKPNAGASIVKTQDNQTYYGAYSVVEFDENAAIAYAHYWGEDSFSVKYRKDSEPLEDRILEALQEYYSHAPHSVDEYLPHDYMEKGALSITIGKDWVTISGTIAEEEEIVGKYPYEYLSEIGYEDCIVVDLGDWEIMLNVLNKSPYRFEINDALVLEKE